MSSLPSSSSSTTTTSSATPLNLSSNPMFLNTSLSYSSSSAASSLSPSSPSASPRLPFPFMAAQHQLSSVDSIALMQQRLSQARANQLNYQQHLSSKLSPANTYNQSKKPKSNNFNSEAHNNNNNNNKNSNKQAIFQPFSIPDQQISNSALAAAKNYALNNSNFLCMVQNYIYSNAAAATGSSTTDHQPNYINQFFLEYYKSVYQRQVYQSALLNYHHQQQQCLLSEENSKQTSLRNESFSLIVSSSLFY